MNVEIEKSASIFFTINLYNLYMISFLNYFVIPSGDIPVIKEINGSLVREMRTAKKISQRDFANAVGMSQSWVRNIETKGKDTPVR